MASSRLAALRGDFGSAKGAATGNSFRGHIRSVPFEIENRRIRCGGSVFWEGAPFPGNLRSFFCPEYSAHPLNLLFHIFRRNKKYKNAHETVDLKHFVGTYIFLSSHETTRYTNYVGK